MKFKNLIIYIFLFCLIYKYLLWKLKILLRLSILQINNKLINKSFFNVRLNSIRIQIIPQKIPGCNPVRIRPIHHIRTAKYPQPNRFVSVHNLRANFCNSKLRRTTIYLNASHIYFSCLVCDWYLWDKSRNCAWVMFGTDWSWAKNVSKLGICLGYSRASCSWYWSTLYP